MTMTLNEKRRILAEVGLSRKAPRIFATATADEWDRNPRLRAEFKERAYYLAWLKVQSSVRIVGNVAVG